MNPSTTLPIIDIYTTSQKVVRDSANAYILFREGIIHFLFFKSLHRAFSSLKLLTNNI